jgi:Family of unknown function (DUF5999)
MCQHSPRCPDARAPDRSPARVLASHPGQVWSLLCHGAVLFDHVGEQILEHPAAGEPAPSRRTAA